MPSPTLVDTDIIIDSGRGIDEAVNCLNNIKATSSLAICVVTQMELIAGCKNQSGIKNAGKVLEDISSCALGCRNFRESC